MWKCFSLVHSGQRILKVSQDLKTQFTLLLEALILIQLVEAARPQLLAILEHSKVLEIFWLPGVDRAPVYVSLTIAQRGPALHLFPVPGGDDSIFADVTQDLDILASDGGRGEGEAGEDQGDSHPLSSELSHRLVNGRPSVGCH